MQIASGAELATPQREAAFFYGLFLQGHSLDQLRQDIDVPHQVVRCWDRLWRSEPHLRQELDEVLSYRRQVLAIFDTLIRQEVALAHLVQ